MYGSSKQLILVLFKLGLAQAKDSLTVPTPYETGQANLNVSSVFNKHLGYS
ncbi:hypothetical protein UF75_4008 [Desulfosporosinus sp. I2]|nr:hypothetical protein UF75_4008 [Desulfosporosinus sp. I2]